MHKSTGFLYILFFLLFTLILNKPIFSQVTDTLFYDSFQDMSNWTAVGPLGQQNWSVINSNYAGGNSAPEVHFTWEYLFVGDSYLLASPVFTGIQGHNMELKFNYMEDYWSNIVYVGVAVTGDGGSSYTSIWELQASGNSGPAEVTVDFTGIDNMQIALYYTGDANDIDFWYVDDVTLMDLDAVPVELTSFTASTLNGNVNLNWTTATETNNKGFEIQRAVVNSNESEWEKIGFVNGGGTTSKPLDYSFTDRNIKSGKYSYRLKQIDFDGTYEYSRIIETKVSAPAEFSLKQNYPNPFNPSTKISFSLPSDSKVSLNVFNILGQQVASLINGNISAGDKEITFDASKLTSGIYLYRLDAVTSEGQNFSSIRKMILTK